MTNDRFAWFDEARLGLFIHWGLYAIPARGEWLLHRERIPVAEYDKLADQFNPPADFSPESFVKMAVRMGAKYAVLTTRHHDGFALWDSKNNPFNSVKTAAKRDFVREFVDACRKHNIRVGLYYSIRSWQHENTDMGTFEQKAWDGMVDATHEQLHELMTEYGKIDLLWYDGCSAPGVDDSEAMNKMWRTDELNAMVRRCQPDIIINDRSCRPEDFSTPEQCLTPPPPGRRWESCMTLNQSWGYTANDHEWKSADTLIRALLHCASHGGNLLLNIGPKPDGSIPQESVDVLCKLGDYVNKCPESIYGAERDPFTEAVHAAGVITKTHGKYWLHALNSSDIDSVKSKREAAPGIWEIEWKDNAVPVNMLGGRHDVAIKAGDAPVLGDNSGKREPPEADLKITEELTALMENPVKLAKRPGGLYTDLYTCSALNLPFPSAGIYNVDVGFVAEKESGMFGDILCRANAPGYPETMCLKNFHADDGTLRIPVPEGFALYALRIQPKWTVEKPETWKVAGIFPTDFSRTQEVPEVCAALSRDMVALAADAVFQPVDERNRLSDCSDVRINFACCAPDNENIGFGFAKKIIESPCSQTVYACLGCDWWADVYVNGVKVKVERYSQYHTDGGPEFTSHKPNAFRMELKEGANEILVCCHGGVRANWFDFFTNMN